MNGINRSRMQECPLMRYLHEKSTESAFDAEAPQAAVLLSHLGYFDPIRARVDIAGLKEFLETLRRLARPDFLSAIHDRCTGCARNGGCSAGKTVRGD